MWMETTLPSQLITEHLSSATALPKALEMSPPYLHDSIVWMFLWEYQSETSTLWHETEGHGGDDGVLGEWG